MKTPNATHTETPWSASEITREDSDGQWLIGNQDEGWIVAKVLRHTTLRFNGKDHSSVNTKELKERAKQDAVHIVKCVNSHEELLESTKQLRAMLKREGYEEELPFYDALIARAEGGK